MTERRSIRSEMLPLDLNDISIASLVDDPFEVVQAGDAEVGRVGAALVHLLEPEVGAVAEVEGCVRGVVGARGCRD